jgi:succinyl-CoA synthetase beta subunit
LWKLVIEYEPEFESLDVAKDSSVGLSGPTESVEVVVAVERDLSIERTLLKRDVLLGERSDEGFVRLLYPIEDVVEELGR